MALSAFDAPNQGMVSPVAYRQGRRYVRLLEPVPLPDPAPTRPFRTDGNYVILGGAGGLGMTVARHLAATYRARVLLVGRSELSGGRQAQLAALNQVGGEVWYRRADITDRNCARGRAGCGPACWARYMGSFMRRWCCRIGLSTPWMS